MEPINYQSIIKNAPIAHSYNKIVLNSTGEAVDFIILEINNAFEQLVLSDKNIINKKASEIAPGIANAPLKWIKDIAEISFSGGAKEFVQFEKDSCKWYKIQVFSENTQYFSAMFFDITEEKAGFDEYDSFFNLSPELLCTIDEEGNFIKTNIALEESFGFSKEELAKKKFFEFLHQNEKAIALQEIKKLYKHEKNSVFSFRFQSKDGTTFLAKTSVSIVKGACGKLLSLIFIDKNASEKSESIKALQKSKQRFDEISELSRIVSWEIDIKGLYLRVSDNVEKIWGYSKEEIEGKVYYYDLQPEDLREGYRDTIRKQLNNKSGIRGLENKMVKKDGGSIWIVSYAVPIFEGDEIVSYEGYDIDITEIKQLQLSLQKSEERLAKIIETLPDMLAISDLEGVITYINPQGVESKGFGTKKEIIGRKVFEFLDPNHHEKANYFISEMFKGNLTGIAEYVMLKKDGSPYYAEINANILTDENNKPVNVLYIIRDVTEKVNITKQLKANELQLEKIIENLPISLSIINFNGVPLYLNPKCRKLFEIEESEYPKTSSIAPLWMNIDDRLAWLDELKKTGVAKDFEMHLRSKKGNAFWVIASGVIINYKNQECVLSTYLDISSRKKHEQELVKEYKQLLSIFDGMDEIIFVSDPDTFQIVFANKKLKSFYNEEIVAKSCHEMLLGRGEMCDACNTGQLKRNYPEVDKREVTSRLGKTYISYNRMIEWSDGRLLKLGIAYDITDRKAAEKALFESEEKLRKLIDTIPDGIVITDLEGTLQFASEQEAKMRAYKDTEEAIGESIFDFIHPSYREKAKYYFKERVKDQFLRPTEYLMLRKDGSSYFTETHSSILRDKDNQPVAVVFVSRDITDKKKNQEDIDKYTVQLSIKNEELIRSKELIEANLEEKNMLIEELSRTKSKLEKINIEKDKFFSIISHDLRSPFQGFIGLTGIIAESIDFMPKEEIKELANGMQNSATNLYKLIENLLQWTQLQRGRLKASIDSINLNKTVLQNIELSDNLAKEKNIAIKNEIPEDMLVLADYQMINTVIRNLISNAIKFTNQNGNIAIGVKESPENKACIYVKDDGIGMSEQTQNDLFRIDKKILSQGTAGERGTGLGLLISKELVEKNNGEIWVESEVGKGSTFYFTLPLHKNDNYDAVNLELGLG
ncbi:MAG: PAS domain-containing sensor histidine kinase [Ignavibacteria bacterium]|nr:PAS domain-containing sensor histidine kinase [Ignavibacteria bacterium]